VAIISALSTKVNQYGVETKTATHANAVLLAETGQNRTETFAGPNIGRVHFLISHWLK
jgi:hypothetical protein